MAKRRKKKNALKRMTARYGAMGFFLAIIIAAIYFIYSQGLLDSFFGKKPVVPLPEGTVEIHMIDVDQADAILIQSGDGFMLIDAADRKSESKEKLNTYLTNMGITTLEWLVLTHPDADHIGGAQMVLENYEVKNVMLPDRIHTSSTYENMLEAIIEEPDIAVHIVDVNTTLDTDTDDITATVYDAGDTFEWRGLHFTVMGPLSTPNNNDSSVVLRMQCGEMVAMLTGDAEIEAEELMLGEHSRTLLDCDLLKVGHHGSSTSSSQAFLNALTPSIALISCGVDNEYGHPHSEALQRLEAAGTTVYRTDLNGSVVISCDGTAFTLKSTQK